MGFKLYCVTCPRHSRCLGGWQSICLECILVHVSTLPRCFLTGTYARTYVCLLIFVHSLVLCVFVYTDMYYTYYTYTYYTYIHWHVLYILYIHILCIHTLACIIHTYAGELYVCILLGKVSCPNLYNSFKFHSL